MAGFDNVVTVPVQDLTNESADAILIFHQEYRFASLKNQSRPMLRRHVRGSINPRQIDFEGGSDANFAVHPHVSAALLDDAKHSRETKTSALAHIFGGEEWFENL